MAPIPSKFNRSVLGVAALLLLIATQLASAGLATSAPVAPPKVNLRQLKTAADGGDVEAMWQLGQAYERGRSTKIDYAEALAWYKKAAELGHAMAMKDLGNFYCYGRSIPLDYAEALKWYRKSADLGNAKAMNNLGVAYQNGNGVEKDMTAATDWFAKSANAGEPIAMITLGTITLNMVEGEADAVTKKIADGWYTRALKIHLDLIKTGDTDAMRNAAWLYQQGLGTKVDFGEAQRLLRQAADLGDTRAMTTLADYSISGDCGMPKSVKTALEWYLKAADIGSPEAMYEMGSRYAAGRDVKVDYKKAMTLYLGAARAGNEIAMNDIGWLYSGGRGVDVDAAKAFEWFKRSAEYGNVTAISNLGICYMDGTGVAKDEVEAVKWLRKASDLGNAAAMRRLAAAYEQGLGGLPKDAQQAKLWRNMAEDAAK